MHLHGRGIGRTRRKLSAPAQALSLKPFLTEANIIKLSISFDGGMTESQSKKLKTLSIRKFWHRSRNYGYGFDHAHCPRFRLQRRQVRSRYAKQCGQCPIILLTMSGHCMAPVSLRRRQWPAYQRSSFCRRHALPAGRRCSSGTY